MRIIAGARRGKKLAVLEGTQTRPTSDRARESLFQLIENDMQKRGRVWGDLTFADVFAGTGAVGCEAASRGAKRVFFFENNQVALKCLKENISLFRNVTLFYDALKPMKAYPPIDILFMDAPYGVGLWEKALPLFEQTGWIGPKTLVVIETDKGERAGVPVGFQENDRRSYGRNTFMLLRMDDK